MNYNLTLLKKYNLLTKLLLIICLFTTALITGCGNMLNKNKHINRPTKQKTHYINNNPTKMLDSEIGNQLSISARSIEKSLATLAATEEINNIPVLNTAPLITPEGGMGGTADIDWTGPIEPLLEKITQMTDYKLKIMGNPSSIPIIISITQSKAIIADILKNASLQAGKRANIVVFPASKILELRYRFGAHNTAISNHDVHNTADVAENYTGKNKK
jgi:defect-in-organelle-trafficking protein DotD